MYQVIPLALASFLKCRQCSLGKLCMPVGLDKSDMSALESMLILAAYFKVKLLCILQFKIFNTFTR